MPDPENPPGVSSLDTPVDWSRFPELLRASHFGGDIDAYLTDIGVDPAAFASDDPGTA